MLWDTLSEYVWNPSTLAKYVLVMLMMCKQLGLQKTMGLRCEGSLPILFQTHALPSHSLMPSGVSKSVSNFKRFYDSSALLVYKLYVICVG